MVGVSIKTVKALLDWFDYKATLKGLIGNVMAYWLMHMNPINLQKYVHVSF